VVFEVLVPTKILDRNSEFWFHMGMVQQVAAKVSRTRNDAEKIKVRPHEYSS